VNVDDGCARPEPAIGRPRPSRFAGVRYRAEQPSTLPDHGLG
jgi:hypothetical protein